ncbi:hypothetical protein BD310DRAFT_905378 [Dichomitus squalens]|uniref:Heterokaryon incompatibility domain-containing protein n=1 Tax=Dichomitus squalens TaxID=114155 RepID=A0A4Q9Q0B2_9APHY|nr:hypothetical protein BD310DRAFT_905378 [Dichomitus squalens]
MIPASYLCWYGVPYLPNRVYDYVERVGLGAYLRKYRLSRKAGDLDVSMTWLNLTEWFEKSGLEMHLRQDIWGQVCDLLDDMKYRWEIQPQWYLNESLRLPCGKTLLSDYPADHLNAPVSPRSGAVSQERRPWTRTSILQLGFGQKPDRETYVQVNVGGVTKKTQRPLRGDPADCDETLVLSRPPAWTYDVVVEHQEDIRLLNEAHWGRDLSRTLQSVGPQADIHILFSLLVETTPVEIAPLDSLKETAANDSKRSETDVATLEHLGDLLLEPSSSPSARRRGRPKWRLVDAVTYVRTGVLKVIEVSSLKDKEFVAVSYRWSKAITDWRARIVEYGNARSPDASYERKLALGSATFSALVQRGLVDGASAVEGQRFFAQIAFQVMMSLQEYFWMDIVCINQDVIEEKEFFVPKMGTLYGTAAVTYAYPTGTSFLSSLASPEIYFPVWETRAWTLQEQIQSHSVVFSYLFDGDITDEVIRLEAQPHTYSYQLQITLNLRVVDRADVVRIEGTTCILWQSSEHVTTCVLQNEDSTGGLSTSAYQKLAIGQTSGRPDVGLASRASHRRAIGHSDLGLVSELQWNLARQNLYTTIHSLRQGTTPSSRKIASLVLSRRRTTSSADKVRISLGMLGGRQAAYAVDMLYSILGILDMEDFPVSYSLSAEEARLAVFEAMPSRTLAFTLGTDWSYVVSANRDSALPRIYDSKPVVGVTLRVFTISNAKFSRASGTTVRARKERFRVWKETGRTGVWGTYMLCQRAGPFSPDLVVLCAVNLSRHPHLSDCPATEIPDDVLLIILLDGAVRDYDGIRGDREVHS